MSVCPDSTLLDSLAVPLHEKLEDWKKYTSHLEREHAKGGSWVLQCSGLSACVPAALQSVGVECHFLPCFRSVSRTEYHITGWS